MTIMRTGLGDTATHEFGELTIDADPRLLQPRSWTVVQATWAEQLLATAPPGAVLDLCCGAGQIGLLVAHRTGRRLVAVRTNERAAASLGISVVGVKPYAFAVSAGIAAVAAVAEPGAEVADPLAGLA